MQYCTASVGVCKWIQWVCSRLFFTLCDCVYVCTCRSVPDASGCLWYFTFPFRQRVSRLAANEPITGSSIWCVLYGSLGSTISTDEGWERCGEWEGQHGEKMHRYCMCLLRHTKPFHDYMISSGVECTKAEDAKSQSGRVSEFPSLRLKSLWNSTSDNGQMRHSV